MKKINNILKDTFKRSMYFNIVYITIMYFLMFYNYTIVTNEIFIGMLAVVLLVWLGIITNFRVKDDGCLYGDIRFRNSAKDRVHKRLGDFEHLYLNVNYRVDGSMRFTSVIAFTVSVH